MFVSTASRPDSIEHNPAALRQFRNKPLGRQWKWGFSNTYGKNGHLLGILPPPHQKNIYTLQGTNISPKNDILKMIFLFPRWDMLIPWRVCVSEVIGHPIIII